MEENRNNYGLDMHSQTILDEYRAALPVFSEMRDVVEGVLKKSISDNGLYINAIELRIKAEDSLAGKLKRKGDKYCSLLDLTDILGARIITFYTDDVDKIAALMDKIFIVDWQNSIDKRKMHDINSFGYNSLHYICRIPESLYSNPEHPEINEIRFEIQMRTAMQHVWATLDHDIGYKSGVEVPVEYLRNLNRLAGILELVDEQFSQLRTEICDYRRKVRNLVSSGNFAEVPLDGDSFRSYMELNPFDKLTRKIAAINQAEITDSPADPYLEVLKMMGMKTLADVDKLIKDNSDYAYQYATYQLAGTDLDIVSSTIAIQDLCVVHLLRSGAGVAGIKLMFDTLLGKSEYNNDRAQRIWDTALQLSFMNVK